VSAGEILAKLDTKHLELQVELAQSLLELQEAELVQLQQGASEAEITAAQAEYEAAVAHHGKLKAEPSLQEITIAKADLRKAEIALQRAQTACDAASSLPDIGERPEPLQLDLARIDYWQAKATYALAIAKPDKAAMTQAASQVAAAKAELNVLKETASRTAVRAAEADLSRIRVNLADVESELEQAILRAPFAGTITSMADVAPGEMVQSGRPILTLADLGELQVKTADLSEWGAANVRLNQIVDMKVSAQGGRNLRGRLLSVSAEPVLHPGGTALYEATVTLEAQDPALRWGTKVRIIFGQPDPYLILASMSE